MRLCIGRIFYWAWVPAMAMSMTHTHVDGSVCTVVAYCFLFYLFVSSVSRPGDDDLCRPVLFSPIWFGMVPSIFV